MAAPLVWGAIVLGGLWLGKEALNEAGEAAGQGAKLAKWAAIGGGLYVSYAALKSSGVLK